MWALLLKVAGAEFQGPHPGSFCQDLVSVMITIIKKRLIYS